MGDEFKEAEKFKHELALELEKKRYEYQHLLELDKACDAVSLEKHKADYALKLEQFRVENAFNIEQYRVVQAGNLASFRATIAAGAALIRSLFLLNGGAAVAVLAFFGQKARMGEPFADYALVGGSVLWFGAGLLATLALGLFTYFGQGFFTAHKRLLGNVFKGLAVLFGLVSTGLAVVGFWWVCLGFGVV